MAFEPVRSPDARALAERALVRLMVHAGAHRDEIVVIGGLNPELLAEAPPVPHLGTTDVDVLIQVGMVFDREDLDFAWLETALGDAGFNQVGQSGWRWFSTEHGVPVKLEILCDALDNRGQELTLPGTDRVTAMNLDGPAPAMTFPTTRAIGIPPDIQQATRTDQQSVDVVFAGLGGYLLAKAAAVVGRSLDKDLYDLAFVLLYNGMGGPREAARQVAEVANASGQAGQLLNIRVAVARLTEDTADGASALFAAQMKLAGSAEEEEFLVQDSIGGALDFLDELDRIDATK